MFIVKAYASGGSGKKTTTAGMPHSEIRAYYRTLREKNKKPPQVPKSRYLASRVIGYYPDGTPYFRN